MSTTTTRVCDRCGGYIMPRGDEHSFSLTRCRFWRFTLFSKSRFLNFPRRKQDEHDICDDCIRSFDEWMKGGKTSEILS